MSEPWPCPRCGRKVPVAFPDGEPVVTLELGRIFLQERKDGSTPDEPAGFLTTMVCLRCADVLWHRLRKVVGPLVGEAAHG